MVVVDADGPHIGTEGTTAQHASDASAHTQVRQARWRPEDASTGGRPVIVVDADGPQTGSERTNASQRASDASARSQAQQNGQSDGVSARAADLRKDRRHPRTAQARPSQQIGEWEDTLDPAIRSRRGQDAQWAQEFSHIASSLGHLPRFLQMADGTWGVVVHWECVRLEITTEQELQAFLTRARREIEQTFHTSGREQSRRTFLQWQQEQAHREEAAKENAQKTMGKVGPVSNEQETCVNETAEPLGERVPQKSGNTTSGSPTRPEVSAHTPTQARPVVHPARVQQKEQNHSAQRDYPEAVGNVLSQHARPNAGSEGSSAALSERRTRSQNCSTGIEQMTPEQLWHLIRSDKSEPMRPPRASSSARAQDSESICPTCHGAGLLRSDVPMSHPLFGKTHVCECRASHGRYQEMLALSEQAGFQRTKRLSTFRPEVPGLQKALQETRACIEKLEVWAAARDSAQAQSKQLPPLPAFWLVLAGPSGVGKTHLMMAIGNAALDAQIPTLFATASGFLACLRQTFEKRNNLSYSAVFERFKTAELLLLDEFGMHRKTPWANEKMFQLINERYVQGLPTILTINGAWQHIDKRLLSRIGDRGLVRAVKIEAEAFRRDGGSTRGAR